MSINKRESLGLSNERAEADQEAFVEEASEIQYPDMEESDEEVHEPYWVVGPNEVRSVENLIAKTKAESEQQNQPSE